MSNNIRLVIAEGFAHAIEAFILGNMILSARNR
jgi:hypothetical protein